MIEFHKKLWRQIVEHKIITIYCLIEEFLKVISNKKEHKLSKISDAEVLFIGYLAVNDFNGNYKKAHCYGNDMDLVTKIEYSRFITRRINQIRERNRTIVYIFGRFV